MPKTQNSLYPLLKSIGVVAGAVAAILILHYSSQAEQDAKTAENTRAVAVLEAKLALMDKKLDAIQAELQLLRQDVRRGFGGRDAQSGATGQHATVAREGHR